MQTYIIVDRPADWPLSVPGVSVVSAREYLTRPGFKQPHQVKVFNLCKSYKYQSSGYYVSLLAQARGHKAFPSVSTIQDMRTQSVIKLASEELDALIQKDLAHVRTDHFVLSIYFGKNIAKRYDRLAAHLFRSFDAPLLRAHFIRGEKWELSAIGPISANAIPESHQPFVVKSASDYLAGKRSRLPKKHNPRFDLAILYGTDTTPPSDWKAIAKFIKATEHFGIHAEVIEKDDFHRLSEFDALFIRETTAVNHHTYKFARRAEAEGMVVIDDPTSIVRCTNKVYLTEVMQNQRIKIPKTIIIHRDNIHAVANDLGFPCILKRPDSSFSQGVIKVDSVKQLLDASELFFQSTELFLAQEYLPTDYDWRIGLIDRKPLYACRYYMAPQHWQIIKKTTEGKTLDGNVECLPLDQVPDRVLKAAIKSANAIGDGLYGVDLKELKNDIYVIEVNDNPNIEAGYEDLYLKDKLYREIADVFSKRLEAKKQRKIAG